MSRLLLSLALCAISSSGEAVMQTEPVSPFTADYYEVKVTKRSDGTEATQRQQGRIYRDGRGRMRDDSVDASSDPVAQLWDPSSGRTVAIDPATGEVLHDGVVPTGSDRIRSPNLEPPVEAPQFRPIETTDLGQKLIDGTASRGRRIRFADGTVSEVWFAVTIPDTPILVTQTGPSGRQESRLTNVRVGEPDPELFKPLDAAASK